MDFSLQSRKEQDIYWTKWRYFVTSTHFTFNLSLNDFIIAWMTLNCLIGIKKFKWLWHDDDTNFQTHLQIYWIYRLESNLFPLNALWQRLLSCIPIVQCMLNMLKSNSVKSEPPFEMVKRSKIGPTIDTISWTFFFWFIFSLIDRSFNLFLMQFLSKILKYCHEIHYDWIIIIITLELPIALFWNIFRWTVSQHLNHRNKTFCCYSKSMILWLPQTIE